MIEVKNVTKIYGKKTNVFIALDQVSLTVPDGATVAIIGKSGSGKSTLMHIMSGLDHPTSGSVEVGGKELSSMKAKELDTFRAKEMSFIFQSFFVEGNQSSYQNVMMPLEIARIGRRDRKAKVLEALKVVELDDKVNELARNLSGGQKQRLAIARSIVNKPKLIFADEPTGNLDSVTGETVVQLLFDMNKRLGSTLIIVTHDPDLAARCQMRVELKDGKIVSIKDSSRKTAAKKGKK
jgi:putative ABC transport system ATP-binding protein